MPIDTADPASESELLALCVQYLHLHRIVPGYSATRKATTYVAGWPDLVFCYNSRFVGAEVKWGRGVLQKAQCETLIALAGEAGAAMVAIIRGMPDIIRLYKALEADDEVTLYEIRRDALAEASARLATMQREDKEKEQALLDRFPKHNVKQKRKPTA